MNRSRLSRTIAFPLAGLALSLGALGCGSGESTPVVINSTPSSLDEAVGTIGQIEQLETSDPAGAKESMTQLLSQLDVLNHLVGRVEAAPGEIVSFYEPQPGYINVTDQRPFSAASVVPVDMTTMTAVDLYQRLAGATAPDTLIQAVARTGGALLQPALDVNAVPGGTSSPLTTTPAQANDGTTAVTSALTAGDGPYFQANYCFKTGDARGCYPNWGGGGYADYNTKSMSIVVAPFSGDGVTVRWQYKGVTRLTTVVFNGDVFTQITWSEGIPCSTCGVYDLAIKEHRWDILNASGDGFHWTFSANWSCRGWVDCEMWPN